MADDKNAAAQPDPAEPGDGEDTPVDPDDSSDATAPSDDEPAPADDATTPPDDATTPPDDEPAPADDTTAPADDEPPPSDDTTTPSDDEPPPSDDTTAPSDDEPPPSDDTTTPSDDEPPPSDDATTPSDDEPPPPDDATTPPDDATTPPDDATTPSGDEPPPPDDATPPPDDTTTPPDDATTPPDDATTPPDDTTTPGDNPETAGDPPVLLASAPSSGTSEPSSLSAAGEDANNNFSTSPVGQTVVPCDGGANAPSGGQPTGDIVITVINDDDGSKPDKFPVRIEGSVTDTQPTNPSGQATFKSIPGGPYTVVQSNACFTNPQPIVNVDPNKTSTGEFHIRSTPALVKIKQLTFKDNNKVEKDTLGPFPSPEWLDGRADQSPVAYTRNKKVSFDAVFTVTQTGCAAQVVEIKATATFASASLEWTGSVTVNPGDKETPAVSFTSNNPLANEVGFFETTDIVWQMNPIKQGWQPAGATRNTLYVTLGDPSGSPNYWTLLDISCRGAAGKSTEDDFVKASFDPFRSTTGDGKGFKRKSDGVELTYWKNASASPAVFTCSDILSRADGIGRCGAWADLLLSMHKIHGVTSSSKMVVAPIVGGFLLVKNLTFSGAGSLSAPYTHAGSAECVKSDGIPGQGKDNPQYLFNNHALVKHSTGIWDPSYGVGPKADLKTWEDGGIAGLCLLTPPFTTFAYKGDQHLVPQQCSQGFIRYTAVAKDTLDKVATKFGIATGKALYDHAYNAPLRALRPNRQLSAGDPIVIPRDIAKINILTV